MRQFLKYYYQRYCANSALNIQNLSNGSEPPIKVVWRSRSATLYCCRYIVYQLVHRHRSRGRCLVLQSLVRQTPVPRTSRKHALIMRAITRAGALSFALSSSRDRQRLSNVVISFTVTKKVYVRHGKIDNGHEYIFNVNVMTEILDLIAWVVS